MRRVVHGFFSAVIVFAASCDGGGSVDDDGAPCSSAGAGDADRSSLTGCWEQTAAVGSHESSMVLGEDGTGRATLYFFLAEQLYRATFDVYFLESTPDATTDTDGETGTEGSSTTGEEDPRFELFFECEIEGRPCAELDFSISCSLTTSGRRELVCGAGSGAWQAFPFSWTECLGTCS